METELNQRLQKLENKMDQILKLLNKNSSVDDKKTTVKEAKPKVERKTFRIQSIYEKTN
jgi:lipid II:glycine glycyltransferase (peptidoglycan interpeptide bridge formation enzyme)